MIRRNTWVLLILLAALVGFAYYMKDRQAKQAAAITPTADSAASVPVVSATEGQPTDVKVQDTAGASVEIKRNETGQWVLQAPTETKADQAAAEAAATQIMSLRILSSQSLGLDVVGLDKPAYVITVTMSSGKTHTLGIGAVTPIEDGYYASVDKGPVRVVDKAGIDALVLLVSQPPYAVTPTLPATEAPPTIPADTSTPEAPAGTGTIAVPTATP